jgi:hypothetical protein
MLFDRHKERETCFGWRTVAVLPGTVSKGVLTYRQQYIFSVIGHRGISAINICDGEPPPPPPRQLRTSTLQCIQCDQHYPTQSLCDFLLLMSVSEVS